MGTRHLVASHSHSGHARIALTIEGGAVGPLVEGEEAAVGGMVGLAGYTRSVHKPYSLWGPRSREAPTPPGLPLPRRNSFYSLQ
jgi:hypothetical protein